MSRLGPLSDLDARKFEVRFTTNEQTFVGSAAGSQKCMGILNSRQRKAARRRLSNSILMIADQTAIDPGLNLRRSDANLSFHPGIGFELAELFIPLLEVAKTVGSELQEV
jgi:hypothetical protein